jgi:hypothetical protein
MMAGDETRDERGSDGGEEQWDFFVSYTEADRPWAEWIAWTLEEAGYRVLLQAWDSLPGSNWVTGMQAGVKGATRTIALLSDDYALSVHEKAEWQAAWAADPDGQQRKLLTVRVADCDRPGVLAQVVSIDMFALPRDEAQKDLLRAAELAISGERAKPNTAPPFPGESETSVDRTSAARSMTSSRTGDQQVTGPCDPRATPERTAHRKYQVHLPGAKGVQIGDDNVQINRF